MDLHPLLQSIRRIWSPTPPVVRAGELPAFLSAQAAFVSQKCTIEYCRMRAGLAWTKLFRERPFMEALEVSRWEAFGAVAADLALLAEGRFRRVAGADADRLVDPLAAVLAATLETYPLPAHRPLGWGDVVEETRRRLAAAQLAPPRPGHQIGYHAGARVFATLPIHPTLRGHDELMVTNNIRFALARVGETMEDRLRSESIVRDLLAGRID